MTEPKVTVQREVRPREAAEKDCLRGQLHAALDQIAQLCGEVAAGGEVIKNMIVKAEAREKKIRELEAALKAQKAE